MSSPEKPPFRLDTILVDTFKGRTELRFSHVISTPLGNFTVFQEADDEEGAVVAVLKLTEPTKEEEQMVLDIWVDMGDGDGFLLRNPDDSEEQTG